MKIAECSHLRIRDGNNYNMDVERMLKYYEARYNLDFRSIPEWESLVHRMHLAVTDAKRIIQDSKQRKTMIIDKLFREFCRPSPFQLTEGLVRTRKKWEIMKNNLKINKKPVISQIELESQSALFEPVTEDLSREDEIDSIGHQNTEDIGMVPAAISLPSIPSTHLPTYVCENEHKVLSSIGTAISSLHRSNPTQNFEIKHSSSKQEEWLLLDQSTKVIGQPSKIFIKNTSLDEQILRFSLLNCTTEYLNVRYMTVTNKNPFHRAKVRPFNPLKLYPGLAVTFEFIFRLIQNEEDFTSQLYFRVGKKVLAEAPLEAFCLPIISKFTLKPEISVPDIVTIPPRYLWHINAKCGFPIGTVYIAVDEGSYNLHVKKLPVNLSEESGLSLVSIDPISPTTESVLEREEDGEVIDQAKSLIAAQYYEEDLSIAIKSEDIMMTFIDECVEMALDIFVFEKTFLQLQPFSKHTIRVRQVRAAHIGLHQDVFEFKFTNPQTGNILHSKNVKVFGEVLPNPIQVQPIFLDMKKSPVTLGYCEDHFTITNNHKAFSVYIKIKLTTKIKQLLHIDPLEVMVTAQASCTFSVRLCSKDLSAEAKSDDLVHFTIKIVLDGHESVFWNFPPIFYEIIAPCSFEFKKTYSKKKFDGTSESTLL